MKIRITEANADKIEAALKAVNGRADTHTYTTFGDIEDIAAEAEAHVEQRTRLAKSERSGIVAEFCSGTKLPSSYKYTPTTTMARITRGSAGWLSTTTTARITRGSAEWFLTSVLPAQGRRAPRYTMTDAHRQMVVDRLAREFSISAPVAEAA